MPNFDVPDETVSTTRVKVHPEKRKEFFQTLGSLTKKIRKERGCNTYRIYEDTGDENSLILVGEWETRASWEEHRKGTNFAVLVGSVQVLSVRNSIDFKLLSRVAGIEAMSAA